MRTISRSRDRLKITSDSYAETAAQPSSGCKSNAEFSRRPNFDTSDVGCVQLANCRGKAIPSAGSEEDGICQARLHEGSLIRAPDNDNSVVDLEGDAHAEKKLQAMQNSAASQ